MFNIGKQFYLMPFIQFVYYSVQLLMWHHMEGFLFTPIVPQPEIHYPHGYVILKLLKA